MRVLGDRVWASNGKSSSICSKCCNRGGDGKNEARRDGETGHFEVVLSLSRALSSLISAGMGVMEHKIVWSRS